MDKKYSFQNTKLVLSNKHKIECEDCIQNQACHQILSQ